MKSLLLGAANTVERGFDRLRTGIKWRLNWWDQLRIRPFRGFGTADELYLRGRVLDDKGLSEPHPDQPTWRNAIRTLRRIETDEIPGARVRLRFRDQTLKAETDEDGFFTFRLAPETPLPDDTVWHTVGLSLLAPRPDASEETTATGRIIVPPDDAEFAIVSDLDDTVVRTGAASKLQMSRVVLLNNAHTRAPFPGVSAFYRALQKGPDEKGHNPMFYVSSSPWNLYGMFEGFFKAYDLPLGPIFLKDYGLTESRLFKTSHSGHKTDRIERLIETYPDLPFVLVGDSGQKDPEIYRRLVGDHAERIRAIFIRDVTPEARDDEVHAIARQVRRMGVEMHLVETTAEAAERAEEMGLLTKNYADKVRAACQRETQDT